MKARIRSVAANSSSYLENVSASDSRVRPLTIPPTVCSTCAIALEAGARVCIYSDATGVDIYWECLPCAADTRNYTANALAVDRHVHRSGR